MSRRGLPVSLSLALLLAGLLTGAVGAAQPLPTSMAAVGDSITRAASTGGSLGADYPEKSWSTGTNETVNSHYLRLLALGAPIGTAAFNESVSGAKMINLADQMIAAAQHQPDYLTVLVGGNDLCTDTVDEMTAVVDFTTQFENALDALAARSPHTAVYVVSIPDVYQLWELFRKSWWARVVWASADICQSLLASPTSTHPDDQARREAVRQRNMEYNAVLASACGAYAATYTCHHDGGAVFGTKLERSDVSGDYFHPSTSGQARLAEVSWNAGYTWSDGGSEPPANNPPTASFTYSCTDLACSFDGSGSSDGDGTIASYAWTFGDTTTSSGATASRTYGADGTYTVTLTVTDDDGATGSAQQDVTVSSSGGAAGLTLTLATYKVKGIQHADLTWDGASSTNVAIYRDGSLVTTTANDGAHTDNIGRKGGGSYVYKVCEAATTTCSNEAIASY